MYRGTRGDYLSDMVYVYNVKLLRRQYRPGIDVVHMHIYINILHINAIRGETVTKDNQNVHVFK